MHFMLATRDNYYKPELLEKRTFSFEANQAAFHCWTT